MLRVMLVDDSQEDVSLLKEGLINAGYDVVAVAASALALADRVAELQPDVIIIDTESPTRDVLEHLSVVSARDPRPIVLFTEDRENATIQAALKAGVSAYVVAGMQPERLQPILEVAVARFEREQALREELRDAQTKLAERKVIERAKGFLMQQKGVSEDEAYRLLRKLAMDRNAKLLDVAQQVVDVAKLLG
ncbi:MAG TPA: ANTAR domain-containing protein [Casimicrobiaceae bacterium]